MNLNVAKSMGNSIAAVNYGSFSDDSEFFLWVTTNHGSDVKQAVERKISEEIGKGHSVEALQIVDELVYSTTRIDLTRNPLRARFIW